MSAAARAIVVKRYVVSQKRWYMEPKLLITYRKSHKPFHVTQKIGDLGWPWRVVTHSAVSVVRYCGWTVSRTESAMVPSFY